MKSRRPGSSKIQSILNIESEKSLRLRIFIGFSTVTMMIGSLFIYEGYNASVEFGRHMEFTKIHANSVHTVEYLKGILPEFQGPANDFDVDELERYLPDNALAGQLRTSDPAMVVLNIGKYQSISLNNISPDRALILARLVNDQVRTSPDPLLGTELPASLHAQKIQSHLLYHEGNEYLWMVMAAASGTVTTVQKLRASDIARDTVLMRLFSLSVVVLWIGFWASFGVAIFVSKHVSKAKAVLHHSATYDYLIGVPNQNFLNDILSSLETFVSSDEPNYSLIVVSVNNIYMFEQTYGYGVKWDLFRKFSARLEQHKSANTFIGRYDSNMFYILVVNHSDQWVQSLATAITKQFHDPIVNGPVSFLPSLSLGISHLSVATVSKNEIITQAVHAVKFAKNNRQLITTYTDDLHTLSFLKIRRSAELMKALKDGQFILLYQPKICLASGVVTGVEALVRWDHPIEGRLSPHEFLDLIETSCIAHLFTQCILNTVIKQIEAWTEAGIKIPIAVNISPYDLQNYEITNFLKSKIAAGLLSTDLLELELTESATTINACHTAEMFNEFESMGIKRSIDDFGTGMSSLSYLKEIPFNTVKIDKTFVENLTDDPISEAIIESVLIMAKKIGWTVVAEGIETKEIAERLKVMGCHIAQGYYFAEPMTADNISSFIDKTRQVANTTPSVIESTENTLDLFTGSYD
ncbi:bifunctional diguanylate cyclase/phosphodiesterase [Motiliproteus sp. MSK22-1]|uniref:putative bifunctional diguanylate cyclase/phosphodiesterase n=1 Tax=Motiliproteus sp. MSK22-1 TaxID=1897630 RepID=UPI000976D571|nr:bifunctional diguanylate cyclase/phosphodiesterase [Motiliproteus sp. MSK22-1]OMH25533.1 hypothetical protein BGP75_23515 [Motiliproteus sp. MSK22-1]